MYRAATIASQLVFLSLLLAFLVPGLAETREFPSSLESGLPWRSDRSLVWSDFRGEPPKDAALWTEVAAVFMTIDWHVTYKVTRDIALDRWIGRVDPSSLEVRNTLDPSRSWVAPGKGSDDVLNHEQGHFDLNEVYRLKLQLSLGDLRETGSDAGRVKADLNCAINDTAKRILDKLQEMQQQYETESNHGTHSAGQALWDGRIALWLTRPELAP